MKEMNSVLVLAVIVALIWFLNTMMQTFEPQAKSAKSVVWRFRFAHLGSTCCWALVAVIAIKFGIVLAFLWLAALPQPEQLALIFGLVCAVASAAGALVVRSVVEL